MRSKLSEIAAGAVLESVCLLGDGWCWERARRAFNGSLVCEELWAYVIFLVVGGEALMEYLAVCSSVLLEGFDFGLEFLTVTLCIGFVLPPLNAAVYCDGKQIPNRF